MSRGHALIAALILPLAIGPEVSGVSRWISLGPVSLHTGSIVIPALAILKAGSTGALADLTSAVHGPVRYFWATGILSSFLDNAPTYLTFFNAALGESQRLEFDRWVSAAEMAAWVDALAFLDALEATERLIPQLEEAIAWYRGEFLQGFSLPDSVVYEEWLLLQRERFQRLYLEALEWLAEGYTGQGEHERALK